MTRSVELRADSPGTGTAAAPPRKPLYLAVERTRVRVVAAGESLVLLKEPAGRQQFPVSRIDRVVCNAHADWSGEALALCLARGITISWIAGGAKALGDAIPGFASPSRLHDEAERFVERPGWRDRYDDWLRSCRMKVLAKNI